MLSPSQAGHMTQTLSAGDRTPHRRQPRKASAPGQVNPASRGPKGRPGYSKENMGHGLAPAVRLRAGSPAAILAVVPHLLGFLPESSIVVIGTEASQGSVKVTLRYDLPDVEDTGLADDIAEHAVTILESQRLTAAVVIGYGPDEQVRPIVGALVAASRRVRIDLRECLRVDRGRYWSYTCGKESCCPAAGTLFDAESHPASAAMATAGAQVLAGREALAASIASLAGSTAEQMRRATRRAEQHVTEVIAKVRKSARLGAARHMIASEGLAAVSDMIALYRGGGSYTTDYQLAWLSVALKDLRVRDDAWARMEPKDSAAHRRLWTDVVRRAVPGHVAAPASLLAFVAWQEGNGALANVAIDRALADDPGYSMALLLRQVISAGAPPSMARLPMTPDEVAASYEGLGEDDEEYVDEGYPEEENLDEGHPEEEYADEAADGEDLDEDVWESDDDGGYDEGQEGGEVNSSHSPDDQRSDLG
jgi:uncharacterized protein DUF4192